MNGKAHDTASDAAAAQQLDHLIWGLVAMAAAVILAAPLVSNFYIVWEAFAAPILACLALAAAGWFYTRWRPDPRLASGCLSTAQVIAFAAVGAPLSYLAASANLPLLDHAYDSIDRALGLDWKALLDVMNAWPTLFDGLRPIYLSLTLQMTTAVLCLAFTGRFVWLRMFVLAFIMAALITIAASAVLPAVGVWPYYGLTAADSPHVLPAVSTSWPVFHGLRDGSFRALVAVGSEGIITFPSLHAALAVILIVALWPIPRLRWLILALNVLMLAATPIDGSHYFIDVIAGIAVAAVAVLIALLAARVLARWISGGSEHAAARTPAEKIPQLAGTSQ
jgi:membrane-associated phospholipid phosphatase